MRKYLFSQKTCERFFFQNKLVIKPFCSFLLLISDKQFHTITDYLQIKTFSINFVSLISGNENREKEKQRDTSFDQHKKSIIFVYTSPRHIHANFTPLCPSFLAQNWIKEMGVTTIYMHKYMYLELNSFLYIRDGYI